MTRVHLLVVVHLVGLLFWGHLLLSRKSHASLILWTLWLVGYPALGIPLYLLLGTDKIHKKRMERFHRIDQDGQRPPDQANLSRILHDLQQVNEHSFSRMTPPELLWDGDAYYDALLEDIEQARHFIHIQTYVWRRDEVGEKVLDALCRAVDRGVQVRLLADEMGSVKTPHDLFKQLKEKGGQFSWYSTVQTRRSRFFFNLRNHRKINVIDGKTAYVGGMNVGNEYAGRSMGPWKDLQLRFSGPVVAELETVFAEDWLFATREKLEDHFYYPDIEDQADSLPVVVVKTGPDEADLALLKSFSILCMHARETLDLFTPYFVPNEHLLTTIQVTAARGVRVRLMIPSLNEHQYMVDIGRANYEPLLEAGVEIYELPGMVHHAKVMMVDDDIVFAGSHNLDIRSYKLNFELSLCFQHRETVAAMQAHFNALFERAIPIDPAEFKGRPLAQKLKQGFVRLFGPVL
jgi:cardiolipin synthase A/B